mmetsp:Transcript_1214/g.3577  ORF Transcript_1214/g.3577 Transcript_1214/m.3577 type:complete len:245 (+) Transcript_1214:1204-1938(+)
MFVCARAHVAISFTFCANPIAAAAVVVVVVVALSSLLLIFDVSLFSASLLSSSFESLSDPNANNPLPLVLSLLSVTPVIALVSSVSKYICPSKQNTNSSSSFLFAENAIAPEYISDAISLAFSSVPQFSTTTNARAFDFFARSINSIASSIQASSSVSLFSRDPAVLLSTTCTRTSPLLIKVFSSSEEDDTILTATPLLGTPRVRVPRRNFLMRHFASSSSSSMLPSSNNRAPVDAAISTSSSL